MASGSPVATEGSQARLLDSSGGPVRVSGTLFVHPDINGAVRERIPTIIIDEHEAMARLVAGRIATLMRERAAAGRTVVLGLATGSTPIGVYRELIRLHRDEGLSFSHVITFNLDEYYPMSVESIHSYHRFMWENLFSHVDIDPAEQGKVLRPDVPIVAIADSSSRKSSRPSRTCCRAAPSRPKRVRGRAASAAGASSSRWPTSPASPAMH